MNMNTRKVISYNSKEKLFGVSLNEENLKEAEHFM